MCKYAEEQIKKYEEKGKELNDKDKDAVRDYYNSLENEVMYCPVCKERLHVGEWFTYNDVCGDSHSPKYTCTNKKCDCCKHKSIWNSDGDFFGGDMPYHLISILFPDDKYAALNSFSKKAEVEIYGHGLKRKIYLHPSTCLWLLQPYIEFKYISNEMGEILGKKWKLKFLSWDKQQKTYCTGYISGLHMLMYTFKCFKREHKDYLERKTLYAVKEFLKNYEKRNWDKRWWYLLSRWYFNNFYKIQKQYAEDTLKLWNKIEYDEIENIAKRLDFKTIEIINFLETSSDERINEYKVLGNKLKEIYATRKK
jgi:hypothetical protein